MESGSAASSVLVSPLAVDDVFRHRTVPEVQELLQQLQLQQANDAEELRSLIGVRYLSFLEGLPEITRMQKSAEAALDDAKNFGAGIRLLADSGDSAVPEMGGQHYPLENQQLRLEEMLPLQNSTPLDEFLFSCEVDASASGVYVPPCKSNRTEPASRLRAFPCLKEGQMVQGHAESLRYLQQQLLLLPSRVWEAARCQKFLEALRLIQIEGTQRATAARAAVRELQQKQGLKLAQQNLERQLSGCWALAQQATRISPSLIVSLRALALRQLASPELPLPVAADAAAAATLIYLLENRPPVGQACEKTEKMLCESAAKWLLGVFFSARVEALESIVANRKRNGETRAVTSSAPADHERNNPTCCSHTLEPAVDAAEAMLVAFSASLEAALFLFFPGTAKNLDPGVADISRGGMQVPSGVANAFAVARAAEAAFSVADMLDSSDVSWALRTLPEVFAVFSGQPCCQNGSKREWRSPCCCDINGTLCPRRRMSSFIEQWSTPLREQLSLLPAEDPRRSLRDIRFLWLRLMERLKRRGAGWELPTGPLFWVCGARPSHSLIRSPSSPEHDWPLCDGPLCPATLALLDALGESCSDACISISERRVKALPLISCHTLNDGADGTSTPLEIKGTRPQNAFEEDLFHHLVDIADLCGGADGPQELRAAVALRAAIATSFLQSLAECTSPLAGRASAVLAASVDAQSSDGYTRDKDAYAALILDARRVEWLFVTYREAESLSNRDDNVVLGEVPSAWGQKPEDSSGADCRRRLALFLAEWISSDSQQQNFPGIRLGGTNNEDRTDETSNSQTVEVVAAARAAAQSLLPSLCSSSFIGYAVGFWPFVRTSVEDLQKSWHWHRTASASLAYEAGVSTVDISGGAMTFLLELNRHIASVSRNLRVESISDSPLLCFAIKAVAAEAVAAVAVAAVAETQGQQEGQHASSQNHLLQLLIDVELLAEALDEPSPIQQACWPSSGFGALPQALHRAVEVGLRGRRCAEALRSTAEEGRKRLQPYFAELLQRRLETGFTASSSLIWALVPPRSSELGRLASVSISSKDAGNAFQLPLLEPRERLSLLPIAPLPGFEEVLRPSSYKKCETATHKSVAINAKAEGEQLQTPKDALKQLHRLRLDDAVDSVSRGLQSWLKRGSSDAEGSGLFPSRSGGGASSGASKGVTAVAAAGSGLAEAWAKQVGHVSALIGHHVESVQRASQGAGSVQRNGKQAAADAPASVVAD
ncbi:hypothetical protein, conserved [Eimeria praecox]|uniref:Conserved oligomeric Golgi complex subunit 1 n=1 Tax=Eimeria praecox TaxID=51316 RepID=U6GJH4_9EIME|nr:hypothetical protein, conserved [Eimeria praecox]